MVLTEEARLKNLRRASLFNSLGESSFLRRLSSYDFLFLGYLTITLAPPMM